MAKQDQVVTRLRRIEGQIRGLIRMVEEDQPCEQIVIQLLAARAALDRAGLKVIDRYIEGCLPEQASVEEVQQARQNLQRTLQLLMRMR